MAEGVEAWWRRRQFSRGTEVPYAVGTYREAWAPYPMLVRQYHPELNAGITLSQIPPAAEVLLLWQCEAGHLFAATPAEQRARPRRQRRRSSWCPECARIASPPRVRPAGSVASGRAKPPRIICPLTPDVPIGAAFASDCAPRPASAAEARLRQALHERLEFTGGVNAVRVRRPFFEHVEVWPDILLPELQVAIEYDSTGRFGLEHVGPREEADRRKDRALRGAGWEVIRLRTGKLRPLGPHDLPAASVGPRTIDRILDELRVIRGTLLVDASLR